MNNKDLQHRLDIEKWLESETRHYDMCGSYDYCAYCDKSEDTPCANAVERKDAAIESENKYNCLDKVVDFDKIKEKKAARKSLTFAEKYAVSDEIVKERYAVLKSALLAVPKGTPKIKNRISKQCDTYRRNGDIVAKITIIGTSLRINLPLDCDAPEYNNGKMPHTDTGHKKVYADVPFQFKVNSKLALKRALTLIDAIK